MRRALARMEAAAFAGMRGVLRLRAVDMTAAAAERSAVVIAPHADDETLGCGCTILRKTDAGRRVRVVVVTDGRRSHESAVISPERLIELRRDEAVEACRRLGVPKCDVQVLGFEDQYTSRHTAAIRDRLAAIIAEAKPEEVYSPSGIDRNPDHRAIASVVDGLVRDGRISCAVYEYPVWFWTLRTWAGPGPVGSASIARMVLSPMRAAMTLRVRTVSTEGYLERKRHALAAHRTQMENLTGEAGWHTVPEQFLGSFFRREELFFVRHEPDRPIAAPSAPVSAAVPAGA